MSMQDGSLLNGRSGGAEDDADILIHMTSMHSSGSDPCSVGSPKQVIAEIVSRPG